MKLVLLKFGFRNMFWDLLVIRVVELYEILELDDEYFEIVEFIREIKLVSEWFFILLLLFRVGYDKFK